jgi:hypothetical protein
MSIPLPVVVFAFNRPRKLSRILQALRTQSIDRLIIFVDGPRNIADHPQVEACRRLARSVDWAPSENHFWENNHGLVGFIEDISLVLDAHPWAVFVEDDCLPMPGFYKFIRQALERYSDYPEVFSICGYQPLSRDYFKGNPNNLISSARFYCWGWASWRDRWQFLLPYIRAYSKLFDDLQQVPNLAGVDLPRVAREMASGKLPDSWDIWVAIACLHQHRVTLLATRGLIRNFGLDRSGVHGSIRGILRDSLVHNRNIVKEMPMELTWLENVQSNSAYMNRLQESLLKGSKISLRHLLANFWDLLKSR